MADEQPPAPVVVLPADVLEAPPPPPAVAAAVAEEDPPDAAVVAPHAEVTFFSFNLLFVWFGNFTCVASFPSPFLAVFLSWTNLQLRRSFFY